MADEISLQSSSHRSIVRIAGELDLVTAPLLRALLKSADDDPTHEFVVTLPGITFMDCAGLAPLLEAHAELGGRLRLRDLPRAVSDVLRLTGLEGRFFIDEATPPVRAGTKGARNDDPTRPPDHPSRPLTDATRVDDGPLVHAEDDDTVLGLDPVLTAGSGAAIEHRIVIEQAVGLLMASLGCDARQASHALFQISWDREVPLHDVAVALVAGAQSPTTVVNDTKLAATVSGGSSRREKRRLPFRD